MYPAAVIFDFDGVIVDTEPIHYRVFQKLLEPLGLGYSWDDYTTMYMGFDDRDAFREVFRRNHRPLSDTTLNDLITQKAHIFEQTVAQGVKAYPGVIELINELTSQSIPLAISSGALRSDILPILAQLDIADIFTTIVTADDVPYSKPDPASYLMARQRLIASIPTLSNAIDTIFAIEDTPAGISSANGAGIKVIAVSNSYPADELKGAYRKVASLAELQHANWFI